jgi:hypothetical protein
VRIFNSTLPKTSGILEEIPETDKPFGFGTKVPF